MASILTTQFLYNQQQYDAVITIIPNEESTRFYVKVLELDLHAVLPGGEIFYDGEEGLKKMKRIDNHLTVALMSSISAALDEHLANMD